MYWLLRKLILVVFWGAVTFSALLAVFALGVGQLFPYLDHYRPQIEKNLGQIVGYPVTLAGIDGRLEGVDPTVSVSGFELSAGGQSAIVIDEMRVRLDTVKSLLTLSPQFTYIRFVRPYVGLQEAEGQWRLKGATPSRNVRNEVGVERVLDYLSAQRNFSIYDAKIALDSEQFGEHSLRIPHIYIFQKAYESLLTSTLFLDDGASPFQISARIDQGRSLLGNYRVKASLNAPFMTLPVSRYLATNDYNLESISFGGDVWLDAFIGKEVEVRAESARFAFTFADGERYDATSSIKLRYSQQRPSVRMDVHNMTIADEVGTQSAINWVFDWSSVTNRSVVRFDQADLGLAHKIANHFLPEDSNASRILNGLNPTGAAKNGSVQLTNSSDGLSFQFLSNLYGAAIDDYNGIPKADNINGVFSLSDDAGYIDFRGSHSQLGFATVYDESWLTDALSGYVSWQQQQDIFLVSGRDLSVRRNNADISAGFRLEVRKDAPDWLALDLHGQNLSVDERMTYLPPRALDDSIMSWLAGAFPNSGDITEVDVLVQSELSEGASPHVRVKMALQNTDVSFDKDWPVAQSVNGEFALDDSGVRVVVDSALWEDVSVNNLTVAVPITGGVANWLNITGGIDDDASKILSTLKSTPLVDSVLSPFTNWTLGGKVSGDFDLAIPFSSDMQPKVRLLVNFNDNPLQIGDLDLNGQINDGRLQFSSGQGITNTEFDIQALGGASHLALTSSVTSDGGMAIQGELAGKVGLKETLAWRQAGNEAVARVSGLVEYTGSLAVNQSQSGQVDLIINSDLLGGQIDLPEPIGKGPAEQKDLQVKVRQHEKDIVIDADYGTFSKARLLLQNSAFVGGELVLSASQDKNLNATIPNGLVVSGDFDRILVQNWQSVIADFSNASNASDAVEIPSLPAWLSKVDLIVDEVVVNPSNTWHNFKVSYSAATDKPLFVSSDEVNFSFSNDAGVPNLHFGFLSWNTDSSEDQEETKGKGAPISAKQIPSMTLAIDQLYFNGKPYGDWLLSVAREGDVVRIDPISSKLKTGDFKGSLFWQDRGDASSVELTIAASGADLAELTKKFTNDDAFVSSKKYKIDVGLSWKGHPFYFDRESVSGRIGFSATNGNFRKVDELPAFLKALGIFNIGALSRRLLLDFSDVYEPGLTYDEFKGVLTLGDGILKTVSPITIISPSAELVVAGEADIVNETLNEKLTATFPLTGTLPLAGLIWGTPQLAGLLFITDKLIGDQLSKVTSVQYKVEGSFNDPVMTPVRYQPVEKSK